ncbi:hypothetical protein [Myroides sp. DW712]|uniref:hypothetical protein n=1 Tax=Myroides sp. DW712 TaxID=3389800 RepID=UPI00397BAEF5
MNIIYLVFGQDISYYQQVFFSIYTALINKSEADRIIVVAENPSYFKQIEHLITIIPLDAQRVEEWKGGYGYFWRLKIKALEHIAKEYPNEDILYLDGDTFIYKPLHVLKAELDQGFNIMHVNEGPLPTLKTKSEKKMWSSLRNKKFANILVDEQTCMWNSGVIGISTQHFATIELALQVCDAMCVAQIAYFTKEQLAFGIAGSQITTIKPSDHVVGHYWANKDQWNEVISVWMKKSLMRNYSIEEMKEEVKNIPFEKIPYYYKHSNTYKRLSKRLKHMFPPKYPQYSKE